MVWVWTLDPSLFFLPALGSCPPRERNPTSASDTSPTHRTPVERFNGEDFNTPSPHATKGGIYVQKMHIASTLAYKIIRKGYRATCTCTGEAVSLL